MGLAAAPAVAGSLPVLMLVRVETLIRTSVGVSSARLAIDWLREWVLELWGYSSVRVKLVLGRGEYIFSISTLAGVNGYILYILDSN